MYRMSTAAAVGAFAGAFHGLAFAELLPADMICRDCGGPIVVRDCGCRAARLARCRLYVATCGCPEDRRESRTVPVAGGAYLLYRGADGDDWLAPACRVRARGYPVTIAGLADPPSVFFG